MKHQLPKLPYDVAALEPHVDARTMQLHHDEHHAHYVDELNAALADAPELQQQSALWLLLHPARLPRNIRARIRNNAGGHVNHSFFWKTMTPAATSAAPAGALLEALNAAFGSVEAFKKRFEAAGAGQFGSGWVWLVRAQLDGGVLKIMTTDGHNNPLSQGCRPLLVNDVWEHAYYLRHQNRRTEYLSNWWSVVDWQRVARRFERADRSDEQRWEDEGGNQHSGQVQTAVPALQEA